MPIPKVFINNISKEIKNNANSYHFRNGTDEDRGEDKVIDVRSAINELFNKEDFVYKMDVVITLKDNSVLNEQIILLHDDYLITMNEKRININDIKHIKKAT